MSYARFKHWFVNVFWYHYKWATLGGLFALVLVISILVSILGKRDADFGYMMVQLDAFPDTATEEMNTLLTDTLGDVNGDGVPYYDAQTFDLRSDSSITPEFVVANTTRFAGVLSGHEMSLIFFADGSLDSFGEDVAFLDLNAYGIRTGTDDPYRLNVTQHPAVQSAGFGNAQVYAAVFAMVKDKNNPDDLYEHQTTALEVLRLLQSGL